MSEKIKIEMTVGMAQLLSMQLEEYGDRLSNDGCNDLGESEIALLTNEDRWGIVKWTKDKEMTLEAIDGYNWMITGYLKSIVDAAINSRIVTSPADEGSQGK